MTEAERARNKGFDSKDRQEFWTAFLTRWPLQTLEQLTLQDYTRTEDRENCLSTWVKYGCESLGATHTRGTWYDTIGIFAVPQGMDVSRYLEKGRRLRDAQDMSQNVDLLPGAQALNEEAVA